MPRPPTARPPLRRGREALPEVIAYLGRYRGIVDDWPAFEAAIRRPLAPCIWANPARIGADALAALLEEEGVVARPFPGLPGALVLEEGVRAGQTWWYCAGLAHAQEAVSQLPVTLLDLAPGQRVLDLCAAPGGKTAQMALAMGNRGTLIANDFSTDRIKALQGNLDRLGIVNVSTSCRDAANWPAQAGQFDRILLDAPCSSEGTLRRNPELVGRLGPALSERLAARQRAMLRKAVQRLRPGGRVLYSTCTLAPEENELVVRDMLREHDGRVRLVPAELPGLVAAAGVTRWQGEDLGAELAHCVRIWPHHKDTGGFFMAVLEKDAALEAEPEPEPADLTPETDPSWLADLARHYGLPERLWEDMRIHRQTTRGLHLAASDHLPPREPGAEGSGLFFLRTNVRPPKLTTAGAMLLAPHVTENRIELDADQRDAYLQRRDLHLRPEQSQGLRWGQVLVSHRGHALGVGLFHRSGTLESLFPKRWSASA
jgi:NOL1/NOP2/sun family putative RNA methylase